LSVTKIGSFMLGIVLLCAANLCADNADTIYATHIAGLPKLEGFTVLVEPPFVVIGDESAETVNRRATGSVRWAVAKLKKDFFKRDPEEIIDIWLFRDRQSYTNHAWQMFKAQPASPFGYFSDEHHALVMNIATGGGTLVHEMVHAFMAANFPECPTWFNEGLASLYEASAEKNGHIVGLINWRYKNLEKAIRERRVLSFEELTAKRGPEFYGERIYHEHYAQARYLCFYLQERGLLHKFYREFVKSVNQDPTGYQTLQRILGNPDMARFQIEWERFILNMRPR
jgi:hypothetical protein